MATCIPKLTAATLAVLMLAACSQNGTIAEIRDLDNGKSLLTSADVRVVNQYKVNSGSTPGRVDPEYITCAEPSPDVAKAVANAFALSGSVDVSGLPSDVQPKVAAAISRSRAESIAQLGERLATIQLLRDGLYRACEAYANGAISDTTYAVMVSRYDDTMITMLMGEFAAGAFGRSLAVLNTTAKSEAAVPSEDPATPAETEAPSTDTKATTTATPASSLQTSKNILETAKVMQTMQRKYIENINSDALEVACISALDRQDQKKDSPLVGFCEEAMHKLMKHKSDLLQAVLKRSWQEKDNAVKRAQMKEFLIDLEEILGAGQKVKKILDVKG